MVYTRYTTNKIRANETVLAKPAADAAIAVRLKCVFRGLFRDRNGSILARAARGSPTIILLLFGYLLTVTLVVSYRLLQMYQLYVGIELVPLPSQRVSILTCVNIYAYIL